MVGSTIRCIILTPEGNTEKNSIDISNKEAVKEVLGDEAQYLGLFPNSNIVALKYKCKLYLFRTKNGKGELNTHKLPSPLNKDKIYGPIILFSMENDGRPHDLSIKRWTKYISSIKEEEEEEKEENEDNESESEDDSDESNSEDGEEGEDEDENNNEEEESGATTEKEKTIYVGNLPFLAKDDEMIEIFKKYGKIETYKFPKYQDSGRMLGYGYITYKNKKSAEKAIEDNGLLMKKYNRELVIGKPVSKRKIGDINKVKPRPFNCKTIFVKNIPYKVTEDEMRKAFQVCGKIDKIRIPIRPETNTSKGFAYIAFQQVGSADIAVKKNGEMFIGGREVFIDYDDSGAPHAGFKTQDGRNYYKAHPEDIGLLKKRKTMR